MRAFVARDGVIRGIGSEVAKSVLITGGSAGIGLALAAEFLAHGYSVILVARNAQRLEAAAEVLRLTRDNGPQVSCLAMDVFAAEAPQALAAFLTDNGIELEMLVLNAAAWSQGEVVTIAADEARRIVYANIASVCELAHALVPPMIERRSGRVLVVGSLAGETPASTNAVYSASKAFLRSWTLSLRQELDRHGVGVSLLLPGVVSTDFVTERQAPDESKQNEARLLFAATPQSVAWCGYRGLMTNQGVIVPGLFYGGVYLGLKLIPRRLAHRVRSFVTRQARTDAA